MPRTAVAVVTALLVVGSAVAGGATGLAGGTAGGFTETVRTDRVAVGERAGETGDSPAVGVAPEQDDGVRFIEAEKRMALTPDDRGAVRATVEFTVPEDVSRLAVRFGDVGSVTDLDGFEVGDEGYAWDGETETPAITLRVRANRSSSPGPEVVEGGYAFVDAGPWAIVPVPQFGAEWAWSGGTVELARETSAVGEGAVGDAMAYLGPHRTHTRTAHGQSVELVVPAAATLGPSPGAVLDTLAGASGALEVGDLDERVLMIAAPVTVDWGAGGVQLGDSDAWVAADERLDTPRNVWLHEYVHTRQTLDTTRSTQWVTEATASYYAALLALELGHVDYPAVRRHLADGEDSTAVLAEPATWPTRRVPYQKGALVVGELDRRLRVATGGSVTFEAALRRYNSHSPLSVSAMLGTIADLGDDEVAAAAEAYITTPETPDIWTDHEHAAVFDTSAELRYTTPPDPASVESPYRTVAPDDVLVVNETLEIAVRVTNDGAVGGPYNATLAVDDRVTASASGRLDAGATTTVTLVHQFETPGRYSVQAGDQTFAVTVAGLATPAVVNRSVAPRRAQPNETVTLGATLRNDADRPGRRTVEFRADGDVIATETVVLAGGAERTVTATAAFAAVGDHTVSVAGESFDVSVAESTPGRTERTPRPDQTERNPLPGPGPVVVLLGLAVAVLLARRS